MVAAESFGREENLFSVLIPTMFKDYDEKLKLAHRLLEVDGANGKISVTLLRYKVDKLEKLYAQIRLLARKKEDDKFQKLVSVEIERA